MKRLLSNILFSSVLTIISVFLLNIFVKDLFFSFDSFTLTINYYAFILLLPLFISFYAFYKALSRAVDIAKLTYAIVLIFLLFAGFYWFFVLR